MKETAYLDLKEILEKFPPGNLARIIHENDLELVKILSETCPECLQRSVKIKGDERVCTRCGLVLERVYDYQHRLPFDKVYGHQKPRTWLPTSHLLFGKNLGNPTLSGYGWHQYDLWNVLAKGPQGKKDLPLRAKQIRILVSKGLVHPTIRRMLNYGSRLAKRSGFHRDDRMHAVFADELGKMIRRSGAFLILSNDGGETATVVKACLVLTVQRTFGDARAQKIRDELKVKERDLKFVQFIENNLTRRGGKSK